MFVGCGVPVLVGWVVGWLVDVLVGAAVGVLVSNGVAVGVATDGVEVAGATMENGLLHIDLQRSAPEMVVQTIRIGSRTGER